MTSKYDDGDGGFIIVIIIIVVVWGSRANISDPDRVTQFGRYGLDLQCLHQKIFKTLLFTDMNTHRYSFSDKEGQSFCIIIQIKCSLVIKCLGRATNISIS